MTGVTTTEARASDADTVAFLQWAAPRLGLRWEGFRRVRGTVRKRLKRRLSALELANLDEYRARLDADPCEWALVEEMCRIPISRFHRDRAVFDVIAREILPALAARAASEGRTSVRVWSAGCASGEEPYTIAIHWHFAIGPRFPGVALDLSATDADEGMIARAERGSYPEGSLRELPASLRERGFRREEHPRPGGEVSVIDDVRRMVTFRREDLRRTMPDGPFDLILCRNVAFTYFDDATQREVAEKLIDRLRDGGALVIGGHESLPAADHPSSDRARLFVRARSVYERASREQRARALSGSSLRF